MGAITRKVRRRCERKTAASRVRSASAEAALANGKKTTLAEATSMASFCRMVCGIEKEGISAVLTRAARTTGGPFTIH